MNRLLAAACLLAPLAASALTPEPPTLKARSYVLMDSDSGQILASRDPDLRVEPASLTKLMTLYIAFDHLRTGQLRLDDQALISEKAWRAEGSRSFMEVGSRVPVETLIHGVIVQSGNDATIALAEHIAGTEAVFADLMNRYAEKLSLSRSHFTNSTGLPHPELLTTARDVAVLSRELIRSFPKQYAWFGEKEYAYNDIRQRNRNLLLWRDPTVDGIKTGHTESAGYSLAASALRDGRRLISVVVGTSGEEARAQACLALLNYGFRFFETVTAVEANAPVTTVRAWKGAESELALGVAAPLRVSVPRGAAGRVRLVPEVDGTVFAPVAAGQPLGTVTVRLDDKVLDRQPLVALSEVPLGNLWQRFSDEVQLRYEALTAP